MAVYCLRALRTRRPSEPPGPRRLRPPGSGSGGEAVKYTGLWGHGLQAEGQAVEPRDRWEGGWNWQVRGQRVALTHAKVGKALCECGEWSPELPSTVARKRWHANHKE